MAVNYTFESMFPNRFKKVGWFLLLLGLILSFDQILDGYYYGIFNGGLAHESVLSPWNQFPGISQRGAGLIFLALIIFCVTKEKDEWDESLMHLRFKSLVFVLLSNLVVTAFRESDIFGMDNFIKPQFVALQFIGFLLVFHVLRRLSPNVVSDE